MPTVIRSPRSKADVLSAAKYIAEQSQSIGTAQRWMESIDEKVKFLAENPFAGEARPDLAAEVRGFSAGNYAIFYRPIDGGIEVIRVLHGARDVPRIFRTGEN